MTVRDPVCGMTVALGAGKAECGARRSDVPFLLNDVSRQIRGRILRTICARRPERETPPQHLPTTYTRPMHPEIISRRPGDCPKVWHGA